MGLYPFDPSRFGRLGVEARLAGRKPLPLPVTDCPDALAGLASVGGRLRPG